MSQRFGINEGRTGPVSKQRLLGLHRAPAVCAPLAVGPVSISWGTASIFRETCDVIGESGQRAGDSGSSLYSATHSHDTCATPLLWASIHMKDGRGVKLKSEVKHDTHKLYLLFDPQGILESC